MVSIMNNSQAQLTFNLSVMFSAELQETKVGDQGPSGMFMPTHLTVLRQLLCARPFQVLSMSNHLHKNSIGVPLLLSFTCRETTAWRRSASSGRQ